MFLSFSRQQSDRNKWATFFNNIMSNNKHLCEKKRQEIAKQKRLQAEQERIFKESIDFEKQKNNQ